MKRVIKSSSSDEFIKKSLKQREIKKFIHDSVKDSPQLKAAKKQDRELTNQLKAEGKAYHRETGEWY